MIMYQPQDLANAVAAICPDIQQRMADGFFIPDERQLWWELSSCLLSSQVPYALAVSAADAIAQEGMLVDGNDADDLATSIEGVLRSPLSVGGRWRSYRFPRSRAVQLAATCNMVRQHSGTLGALVKGFDDASGVREWLVAHAPGLGPKQASMFLRNAGISYDLAILDRHVLHYMVELGLGAGTVGVGGGLARYRQREVALRSHAQQFDCPVGILDWAIWIVMRVVRRNTEVAVA